LGSIWQTQGWRTFVVVMIIGIAVMMLIVFVEDWQRRIPVQYARRQIGRRTVGSTTTYIPIKVNMGCVIPGIFASSMLMLHQILIQLIKPNDGSECDQWVVLLQQYFGSGSYPVYKAVIFLMTIIFTYFCVTITFNSQDVTDNMKRQG